MTPLVKFRGAAFGRLTAALGLPLALLAGCGKPAPAADAPAAPAPAAGGPEKTAELLAQNNALLVQTAIYLAELRAKDQRIRELESRWANIRPGLRVLEAKSSRQGDHFETQILLGASVPMELKDCKIKLVFTKPVLAANCAIVGPKDESAPKPEVKVVQDSILEVTQSTLPVNQYILIIASTSEETNIASAELSPAPQG